MQKVNIETSQNVSIHYSSASLMERIIAYVIDYAVIILYIMIVYFALDGLIKSMFDEEGIRRFYSLFYLLYTPALFYHLIFEYFNNGQSIGKMIMKLRVIQLDGSRPTLGSYIIRWLLGLAELALFSGAPAMLFIMFSKRSQRIGDIAANTSVIKIKQARLFRSASDYQFNFDYEPTFPKVSLLNDAQISLINDVLFQPQSSLRNRLIKSLAEKLQKAYSIHPKELKPRDFLVQIVKDYAFTNWLEENKGQLEALKDKELAFNYGKVD